MYSPHFRAPGEDESCNDRVIIGIMSRSRCPAMTNLVLWLKLPPTQEDSRLDTFHTSRPLPPCNRAAHGGRRGGAPGGGRGRECHVKISVLLGASLVTLALATSGGGGWGG